MENRSQYQKLRSRYDELTVDRRTTETTWQEISDNLLGRRDFTTERTRGQQRLARIYDDTSKVSGGLLAGAMHSLLTSPAARWFALRFEDPRLQEVPDAAAWLKMAEKHMYAAMGAPRANFHSQLSETYIDLIYFGTGGLFIDDVPGVGTQFSARPLQELYIAEDPSGRIDTVIRQFKMTARQAVAVWGDKAKTATSSAKAGKTEDRSDYVHIILPNDDIAVGKVDETGMPWASFHFSLNENEILSSGGFHELPIATPRWEKDAGEIYGRGPGWNALSTQKMLNEMKKVTLKAGQKAVDPPMMVDSEGVLPGDLRFHPGGVIPINSVMSSMNPPIQPLPFGGDFNISVALIEDARKSVQDAFHHQLIETIRDPRMTATQVLELSAQMQRHLAPILGRMNTELLEPIIERVFAIEARAGRLPPAPEGLQDHNIKIDYVSPVARAQQTADARAIIDFSGIVSNLAAVAPDVLDIVDFDEGARELSDALGVPPTMIRDAEQVEARREAQRRLAAEQAEAEKQAATVDQISKLAKSMPNEGGTDAGA
jgi:hypothetical protein